MSDDNRRTYGRGAKVVIPSFVVVMVLSIAYFAIRTRQLRRDTQQIMSNVFDEDAMAGQFITYCTQDPDAAICDPESVVYRRGETDAGHSIRP